MTIIHIFSALLSASILITGAHASLQCATSNLNILGPQQAPLCGTEDNASRTPISPQYKHRIWSHEPFCVAGKGKQFCTHTTFELRNGNGLSVIAHPVAARAIASVFPASKSARQVSEDGLEVRMIPGKGKGLVTVRLIKKGQTILLDPPRIIASAQFPSYISKEKGLSLFNTVVDQLPAQDRELILSLDKSLGGTDIENVMKTNAFACQVDDGGVGDGYMCLFPSVARINHACRPNSHARFIPKSLLMEIKAMRDIQAGEEISISYGKIELKHTERQRLYKDGWNFTCTCSMCTATVYDIAGSDQRRARFTKLRNKLDSLTSETFDAAQVIGWEKEIMDLSTKEGLDTLLAQDYERLAYVYAGHGMTRDAKLWAEKAKESLLEWTIVEGGPDHDIRRVEDLLKELGK